MTYEGIATLLIRFAAVALIAYLLAGLVALAAIVGGSSHVAAAGVATSTFVYIAGAIVVLISSRGLGRPLARGL
jgi:hypothetical protein